jgi:hypothetical protein
MPVMITNAKLVEKLESTLSKNEGPLPYSQALKIFSAMWEEAEMLGIFPAQTPLEGIETDIRIASVLNACLKSS